jgi:hypothetical protein
VPKPFSILDPQRPPSESDRKPRDLGVSGASVESTPPKKRRRFTASEKLRLLKAAEVALASGERGRNVSTRVRQPIREFGSSAGSVGVRTSRT